MTPGCRGDWRADMIRLIVLAILLGAAPLRAETITAADITRHVVYLADDGLQGRYPGTEGGRLTARYISMQFAASGLQPAGEDGWYQPVSIVTRKSGQAAISYTRIRRPLALAPAELVAIGRKEREQLDDLPIFVASASLADDTPLPDLTGHLVLLLDSIISHESGMEEVRRARALHSRFLAAHAAAILVVTERSPRLADLFMGLGTNAIDLADVRPMAKVEGAISMASAVALVAASGQDWDKLTRRLAAPGAAGTMLTARASMKVETRIDRLESGNVIGRIPGRKPKDGAVLFLAHWDHLGICAPPEAADRICNGAIDNATGIAVLIELARQLARSKPDRDIYLMATTGEELGLLGIENFVRNPPLPLKDIVAAFNLDTLGIAPRGADVALIGKGRSNLDQPVERIIRKHKLQVAKRDYPQQFLDRQDGWLLTLAGVPALMVNSGFSDPERAEAFLADPYHKADDEYRPGMDMSGAVQDANLHLSLAHFFASVKKYPANRAGERRAD